MPELFPAILIFLDANVLISASLTAHSRFLDLWRMRTVTVSTSTYAVVEAKRHLSRPQLETLQQLLKQTKVFADRSAPVLPVGVHVVDKDAPILSAALEAEADYLLTGDKRHFGHLFETRIRGTYVCQPASFLLREAHRLSA